MTQINSIKLGVIVMCVAIVTLSLAQTPRIGTSGSNQTGATNRATLGHSGLSGNFTSATQLGTNPPSSVSTGPNTNAGAHIGMNAGAQTGMRNQTGGIVGGPAAGLSGLSGNSTGTTQTGTNVRAGTNTTANTNAGAHTAAAAVTPAIVNIVPRQFLPAPTPLGANFSTAGESPSPLPSASVTPTPTPTPAQVL